MCRAGTGVPDAEGDGVPSSDGSRGCPFRDITRRLDCSMIRTTLKSALLLPALLVVPLARGEAVATTDSPWRQVSLPAPAGCAFDTPFSFFVRESPAGPAARLLVYFEGGGACWDWVSCSGTFDSSVVPDEVAEYSGIFDFTNSANPFEDFTTVFIPYCTGDVHVGTATRRYGDSTARPLHHNGSRNVRAVLDWVERQGYRPPQVVVAGTSAGSYGALFHFPTIARMFPRSRLALIGDSGVPLLPDYPAILRNWGAEPALTLEVAHREAALAARGGTTALITSDQDVIQSAFYIIARSNQWRTDAYRLLDRLTRTEPGFRSFIVAGSDHQLLPMDQFYRYEAGGMTLRDWVERVVEGLPVTNRRCEACQVE